MKTIKFVLKVAACIYAALFCMCFGIELYRQSPEFRRGYDVVNPVSRSNPKGNVVGFRDTVVKGIGY